MAYAWVENGSVRDVCHGEPSECYHPDIAKLYATAVPESITSGATLVDGVWTNPPPPPEPVYAEPEPPKPVVPTTVTMRQARLALLAAGLLGDVEAAIATLPSPHKEAAKIEWEYSQEVQRHNGFVAQLGPALSLDAAALDALFVAAAGL